VKIEQIHIGPITTPDCPDPTESPRYIRDDYGFYGLDTVFLEDATWKALSEIACERGCTVDELCSDIELNFAPGEPFAPAARRYVLRTLADIPDNIELPADFHVLKQLRKPPEPAMTDKAAAKPVPDAELASNIATVKRGIDARVAGRRASPRAPLRRRAPACAAPIRQPSAGSPHRGRVGRNLSALCSGNGGRRRTSIRSPCCAQGAAGLVRNR
jgi:predicted DNA-binding ribbon-helix-helix protein